MGRGVLRTNVDDILVVGEQLVLLRLQVSVLVQPVLHAVVRLHVVLQRIVVVELPVLAEGESLEVAAKEETAHVGMTQEQDAEEVVDLTLQQVGNLPDVNHGGDNALAVDHLGQHLHRATLVGRGVLQDIDATQAFLFAEVFTYDSDKIVEALLVLQVLHFLSELVKVE